MGDAQGTSAVKKRGDAPDTNNSAQNYSFRALCYLTSIQSFGDVHHTNNSSHIYMSIYCIYVFIVVFHVYSPAPIHSKKNKRGCVFLLYIYIYIYPHYRSPRPPYAMVTVHWSLLRLRQLMVSSPSGSVPHSLGTSLLERKEQSCLVTSSL